MTTMGIIFANIYDSSLGELTNKRTMASLPYGGRYRQIDFSLSNMTNSAIRHIGIITKYNYQSLMNHIGSGQEWDLELGEGGLEFLTPFAMGHNGSYRGKLEALDSAMNFLKISTENMSFWPTAACCAPSISKDRRGPRRLGRRRHRRGEGRHLQWQKAAGPGREGSTRMTA